MNRGLLALLAIVGGASVYMGSQSSDDDLVASGKGGRDQKMRPAPSPDEDGGRSAGGKSSKGRSKGDAQDKDDKDAWVGAALIDGVTLWQARMADVSALESNDKQAWASMQPPPPFPPPAAPPPPPPPPTAPPFPHQWVGRFNDEVLRAIVTGPSTTWVVKAGDVIEGQWRVDRIQDRTMSLTYLPLKQQQTVVMR